MITINIEKFNDVNCPFTIERSRGTEVQRTSNTIECILQSGDNVFFVLEFKPKKRGSFNLEVPIHVCGMFDNGMFNKLSLEAEFPPSSIDIEPTEIYLMSVPLNIAIEESFKIQANHFDNVTLIQPKFSTVSRCNGDLSLSLSLSLFLRLVSYMK